MSITIQSALPDHREDLVRLLEAQLTEHSISISTDRLFRAVDGVFENPERGALWIARDGLKTVGVAYVSYIWAMEHGGRSAWLEELYVLPEYREGGLGSKILDQVIHFVREKGCAALDLEVESDHKRVESLYIRNGFSPLTRARWVKSLS